MSVQPITQTISVDDAVELVWERTLAGEFKHMPDAVRALWHSLVFSQADLEFLALEGLMEVAERGQRHRRSATVTGRSAIGFGAPHGKKWDRYIALTWPYESADGSQKSLLDFTDDDLSTFAVNAGTFVDAWTRRRDWAVETAEQLKEHQVARVRDLPAFVLAEVNEAAQKAMGRQE